jgi:DNA topoisomerase-3
LAKSLVITEKPSVARDIVSALGGFRDHDGYWESDDYVLTFSVGHIVELLAPEDVDEKYKRWVLENLPILPEEFKLKQKTGQSERIRTIKKLLNREDVDNVINACDAGREGELIFREILEFLASDKPTQRLWLQSMTTNSIRNGFSTLQPGELFDGLGHAAACRSRSDWLIGMNATRALTRRLQSRREKTAWSAGRVQTPTLALVCDRELEILAHVPVPYWRLEAHFNASDHAYTGVWFDPDFRASDEAPDLRDDRIFDESRARATLAAVEGQPGTARETRKPSREAAPPLFDLTSLQREGNRRFGWSARRTLNAAQRCYEAHKLLTYPRTASRALPSDYRDTVDEVIQTLAGSSAYGTEARTLKEKGLENTKRTFDDSKISDHFAVIPTGKIPDGSLRGDDARLFDLVTRRFLANFYPPAIWNRVERTTEVAGHSFRSRSRTLDEPGWRSVMGQEEQEEQALPPLAPGQTEAEGVGVQIGDVEQQDERTRPAARITEARLLSLMENAGKDIEDEELAQALREKGIGTPATRADIIENLIAKGYLVRHGKALRPTVKGIRLVDVLRRIHIDRLASAELTGDLEYQLNQVEQGELSPDAFMNEIVAYTKDIVDRAVNFDYNDLYPDGEPFGQCPLCKRPIFERSWFYRCKEDPDAAEDCPFRIWKDKSGRYMDHQTVKLLLKERSIGPLEGFAYRDGRTYAGNLSIEEDGELRLEAVAGTEGERESDTPEYEVDERPLGTCPVGCGAEVIETPTEFVCRTRQASTAKGTKKEPHPCSFILPRTVCKREITRDEAEQYMTEKKTDMLQEFTSRYGRPFSAILFLKENGRHGFEFAPRAPRKKATRKKAGGKKTTRKKTTRKKSTRKKAAAKKPARKKSSAAQGSTAKKA